jgi:hypothetical protein
LTIAIMPNLYIYLAGVPQKALNMKNHANFTMAASRTNVQKAPVPATADSPWVGAPTPTSRELASSIRDEAIRDQIADRAQLLGKALALPALVLSLEPASQKLKCIELVESQEKRTRDMVALLLALVDRSPDPTDTLPKIQPGLRAEVEELFRVKFVYKGKAAPLLLHLLSEDEHARGIVRNWDSENPLKSAGTEVADLLFKTEAADRIP